MKQFLLITSTFLLILVNQIPSLIAQGGNALDFDGVDDLVTVNNAGTAINTLEFYVNSPIPIDGNRFTTSLPFGFNSIGKYVGFNEIASGLAGETLVISSGTGFSASSTPIPAGWHHIAIVSDGSKYTQFYLDGNPMTMIITDATLVDNSSFYMGGNPLQPGLFFDGQLDEVRLWSTSRSQPEIMGTLNQELTGSETGLLAYYNFNIGTANGDNGSSCPSSPCLTSLPDVLGASAGSLTGFALTGNASNWVNSTAPLPVEFLSFSAKNIQGGISLNWETTQEINNSGFEVEFSTDVNSWQSLGFIEGKGTGSQVNSYRFLHNSPIKGINYYRIKQIDVDGVFDFSDMVSIYSAGLDVLHVYPNPGSDQIFIDGLSLINSRYQVLNSQGQIIQKGELNENRIDISTLAQGMYFLNIYEEGSISVHRIVKN